MNPEYYPDIRWLIDQTQWKTYQRLLEDEMESLRAIFEVCGSELLSEVQVRAQQTKKIMRMPGDLTKEHEASVKELK